ncbi:WD40 repeat domain-containing protein [Micromonospora zhanjiangensis]|uniref:WD40 repeat domain-containing protein n=1 Tax=Micromonospora zhanjiangensis TaxID=1522057 RepID=A0ABV8KQ11_9ACTN
MASRSGHLGRVQALAFTPDGSHLLSGGDDGKLLLWTVG